jgi:DNA-binding response OmpR family regulator
VSSTDSFAALFVDDEPQELRTVIDGLLARGVSAEVAQSGEEGLALAMERQPAMINR